MSLLADVQGFINSNPGISQLANNVITGLGPKPAPQVVQQAPAVQTISIPSQSGMSTGKVLGIGAAVVVVGLLMVMVLKRKGR
jgi:hypothetical protein